MYAGWTYVDSSAFVKLFAPEPEADAVERAVEGRPVSSELLITESMRAARRLGGQAPRDAAEALSFVTMVPVDRTVLERAGEILPGRLRSLDAIHLATIMGLAGGGSVITYDHRFAAAAESLGIPVLAPR